MAKMSVDIVLRINPEKPLLIKIIVITENNEGKMFSKIDHDSKNNIYCWFDYKGVPSRWVELCGRHVNRHTICELETVKRARASGIFDGFPQIKEEIK